MLPLATIVGCLQHRETVTNHLDVHWGFRIINMTLNPINLIPFSYKVFKECYL